MNAGSGLRRVIFWKHHMKKPRTAIADMHVVVDLAGARAATTVAADLARRLDAHLTGLSLALTPLLPVYSIEAPVPADVITEAHEGVLAEAKAAGAEFET